MEGRDEGFHHGRADRWRLSVFGACLVLSGRSADHGVRFGFCPVPVDSRTSKSDRTDERKSLILAARRDERSTGLKWRNSIPRPSLPTTAHGWLTRNTMMDWVRTATSLITFGF